MRVGARDHSKPGLALAATLLVLGCATTDREGELRTAARLLRAGKQEKALEHLEAAIAAGGDAPPSAQIATLLEAAEIAGAYPSLARQSDSERWLAEGERIGQATFPARHPLRLALDRQAAHFHVERGSLAQARDALERYLARVEWRGGARAAALSLEASMLERVYEALGATEERDAWRTRRARLRAGAPDGPDAVARTPLPPARPNLRDGDGAPAFLHPGRGAARLRVSLETPRVPADGLDALATRALVEDALRRVERALSPALPGFGFEVVRAGSADDAEVHVDWARPGAHGQVAFGQPAFGPPARGLLWLSTEPWSGVALRASAGELRAEALRGLVGALGLPPCRSCDSLLATGARRHAHDRITEADATALAALLTAPSGVRVDGSTLSLAGDPPPGLLAELPLIRDGLGDDLRVDLRVDVPPAGSPPLLAVLDSAIATSAVTPAFARTLGVDADDLAGEPHAVGTRLGRELRFTAYGPRESGTPSVYLDHAPVGMDFLGTLAIEILFERGVVRFLDPATPSPADPAAIVVPLALERGLPHVELALGGGRTRALLDLGQEDALVLTEARALELGLVLLAPEPAPAYRDLDAPLESRLTLERLEIGSAPLADVPVRVARGAASHPLASARLPGGASLGLDALRRFERVRLDPVHGELWLVPAQRSER